MGNIPVFTATKALDDFNNASKGSNAVNRQGLETLRKRNLYQFMLIPISQWSQHHISFRSSFNSAFISFTRCLPYRSTIFFILGVWWSDIDLYADSFKHKRTEWLRFHQEVAQFLSKPKIYFLSYCWNSATDYRINSTGHLITPQTPTSLRAAKHYPYILFLWCIIGYSFNFIWKAISAPICKEVEFVRHGVEEASAKLLAEVKAKFDNKKTYHQETDFSKPKVSIKDVKITKKNEFNFLELYLLSRTTRYFFVARIFLMRLIYSAAAAFCAAWLYRYFFIEDKIFIKFRDYINSMISQDGRNLSKMFNCKLPSEYVCADQTLCPETVKCYFKGHSTRWEIEPEFDIFSVQYSILEWFYRILCFMPTACLPLRVYSKC